MDLSNGTPGKEAHFSPNSGRFLVLFRSARIRNVRVRSRQPVFAGSEIAPKVSRLRLPAPDAAHSSGTFDKKETESFGKNTPLESPRNLRRLRSVFCIPNADLEHTAAEVMSQPGGNRPEAEEGLTTWLDA